MSLQDILNVSTRVLIYDFIFSSILYFFIIPFPIADGKM